MKPLAEHGTTARAKGRPAAGIKGCPCRPCRDAENAYNKRRRFFNESGRTLMVDSAPTQAHLKELFAEGAGWTQLAAATTCSSSTLVAILNGERPEITRRVASQILAVQAADVQPPNRKVPAIGSIRRCHALVAAGHKFLDIAEASPLDLATIRYIINDCPERVSARTAAGVVAAYRALSGRPGTSARSRNRAARDGWAPPGAWDDDRLDDPSAVPDWTGHCGTDRGWWLHRLEDIPVCTPCTAAHEEWKTERAHLTHSERWSEIGLARSQARSREADLAHDARELMRFGADVHQVAERLGVSRNHLQQAMLRHPADEAVAA